MTGAARISVLAALVFIGAWPDASAQPYFNCPTTSASTTYYSAAATCATSGTYYGIFGENVNLPSKPCFRFLQSYPHACRLRGLHDSVGDDSAIHRVCQLSQPRVPVSHQLRQWLGRQPHHLFLHIVNAWRHSVLFEFLVWKRGRVHMPWADHHCVGHLT